MNRTFAITGLLAAGMAAFWVGFILFLPWFHVYGFRSPSPSIWLQWAAFGIVGVAVAVGFLRFSLVAHWVAFRRNTAMPPKAWRGAGGVYLLVMVAFTLPLLLGDPSHTHQLEMILYACLAALCLMLAAVAFARGVRRPG